MAYPIPAFVNGTQTQSTVTVRQTQPINNSSSVIQTAPLPFMVQRPQRRTGSKKSSCTGTPGKPNLKRFKPTEASHARMLLKIRQQADHACLPAAGQAAQTFGASLATNSADAFASIINFASEFTSAVYAGLKNTLPGFPVAEAAENSKLAVFTDIASFVAAFKNDFDIRVSPDLKDGSLQGVTIVIGEIHFDPDLKPALLNVLKHLSPERGDMLLMEGGADVCKNRIIEYGIPSESCVNLEDNSEDYQHARNTFDLMSQQLQATAGFIGKHMISAHDMKLELKGEDAFREFINKYKDKVPAAQRQELNTHLKKCREIMNIFEDAIKATADNRENLMFEELKKRSMRGTLNIALFGAQHVFNLTPRLEAKMIFMMPHLVVSKNPELKLPAQTRQEL